MTNSKYPFEHPDSKAFLDDVDKILARFSSGRVLGRPSFSNGRSLRPLSHAEDVFAQKTEWFLTLEAVATDARGDLPATEDPAHWCREDFRNGALNVYRGSTVAYHGAVLVGQSRDTDLLYATTRKTFDTMGHDRDLSGLRLFLIPSEGNHLGHITIEEDVY